MKWEKPEWRAELSSTNTALASIAKTPERAKDGYILAAHSQTHGKGRLGRNWCSQPGLDLTFSFLLKGMIAFRRLASLPMAVSLAVAETLQDFGITANTKWPNDLLVGEHKICGILAERITKDSIVVGIGLNVNMDLDSAKLITRPATSIFIETSISYDVEYVLDKLLSNMSIWVDRWRADGFLSIKDPWINRCLHMGKKVSVGESEKKEGVVVGLGDAGQLLVRQSTGEVLEVWAGDLDQTIFNN